MIGNWKTYKIEDIASKISIGPFGSRMKSDCYVDEGIPVIRGKNLGERPDFISDFVYITEKKADELLGCNVFKGDLVFPHRGAIGEVGLVTKDERFVLSSSLMKLTCDNTKADSRFVYYFFKSDIGKRRLLLNESQVGTPGIGQPLSSLRDIDISLPELPEQRAISSILSAIDDKIELNLQMNKTLEEMAMTLYKHWFVDFGPFQDGEFIDSELGMIPKGWEVLPLSDVTLKITDGAHHSPKTVDNGMPMASVKDMDSWGFNLETCRQICEEDYFKLTAQGCRPLKGDVLIAKDGSYLKHSFIVEKDLDIVLLSSIAILKPNRKLNPQLLNLYLKLDSVKERMKTIVSGAAIQRIVLKEFRNFLTIVPPPQIQEKALERIEGLIHNCWNNNNETQTLTTLRDTLLPKLISGEVRVKDAEKALAEVFPIKTGTK